MMLLDGDMTSRNNAIQFISDLKVSTPEFGRTATEKDSQTFLNQGIAAFNKGLQGYATAADLLTKSIRASRLSCSLTVSLLSNDDSLLV